VVTFLLCNLFSKSNIYTVNIHAVTCDFVKGINHDIILYNYLPFKSISDSIQADIIFKLFSKYFHFFASTSYYLLFERVVIASTSFFCFTVRGSASTTDKYVGDVTTLCFIIFESLIRSSEL